MNFESVKRDRVGIRVRERAGFARRAGRPRYGTWKIFDLKRQRTWPGGVIDKDGIEPRKRIPWRCQVIFNFAEFAGG